MHIRSKMISGRRPFVKDETLDLDYDLESELDWDPEEDEQGESLSDADEPEGEGEEGSDVDEDGAGFCVPDGYLSADEGGCEDVEPGADEDGDQEEAPQVVGQKGLAKELGWLQ
eukprot:scaffold55582_cov47-Prasinocladus_malaysianus.AAC.1